MSDTLGSLYRGRAGQWAFMSHRITGFLVLLFLLLHVVDVSLINVNRELFDEVHDLYGNIFLRFFEVGLLGALVFHALNGLRVIMYDFFPGSLKHQKTMLWGVVFISVLATIIGGYVILEPAIFRGDK